MKLVGKILYVDIDGILCRSNIMTDNELDYNFSVPIQENIDKVNELYKNNKIVIYTARGKRTLKKDWKLFTMQQLKSWGVKYHNISFDKPHFDLLIDDKSINGMEEIL